jgi:hypothetical protein
VSIGAAVGGSIPVPISVGGAIGNYAISVSVQRAGFAMTIG